ncbi:type II toxin-antitoxin system death-on-curing family toxin [Vibrio maritimus]|uniref:type II toxin-antitoxin system death-on-curing family toxin n=1 Tax=Vibrio maritimus TaxID=990268 RepID=UPI0040678487
MSFFSFDIEQVKQIHDLILETEAGLQGYYGDGKLGGALGRIDDHIYYNDLNEVYDIAALYIEAIAKGHCFADANKRTSLVVGLEYLKLNGIEVVEYKFLAHMVALLAAGHIERDLVATILYWISAGVEIVEVDMTLDDLSEYLQAKMIEHDMPH